MAERISRSFFRRDATTVARALLGQSLVRVQNGRRLAGYIVETEAYLGVLDKAAHTYNARRTPRNESMWRDGGHTYVYFTYGMHFCLNVVAGRRDEPVAVLLRALEPLEGVNVMYRYRKKARRDADLCSGPAKLTEALAIDREFDGIDLIRDSRLFIEHAHCPDNVVESPRIGVGYAEEWADRPLRFFIKNNPHVSRKS